MGLLDQVLGQVMGRGGAQSAPSSGGVLGGLGGMMSGNRAPLVMALLSLLASRQGGGAGGLGGLLGGGSSSGAGGMLGQLGGLLGGGQQAGGLGGLLAGSGVTGGALAGGLGELLNRFAQKGHGAAAQSWVSDGPNTAITPQQLDDTLEPGTVDELSRQTGMERGDLLSQLSSVLPGVVDKLTPHGRLPTQDEHSNWI